MSHSWRMLYQWDKLGKSGYPFHFGKMQTLSQLIKSQNHCKILQALVKIDPDSGVRKGGKKRQSGEEKRGAQLVG